MSRKAGIVTFHCVPNYGAVLQTYGLQEVLKKYIDDVEIVDYRPEGLTGAYKIISTYSIFSLAATAWAALPFKRKCMKFEEFRKNKLHLSAEHGKEPVHFADYEADYIFVGSDQIWNPDITGGFDPAYFGQIGTFTKVVAYGASIGKPALNDGEKEQMNELLKGVGYISVREPDTKELLPPALRTEAAVVVDPTILAGRDCFQDLAGAPSGRPYVLMYSLNGYPETLAAAEKAAEYLDVELIELSGRRKPFVPESHKAIYDAGPAEFVSWLAHAEYVVTDSFHGAAFSLLFHKELLAVPHKTRGGRTRNLMSVAGLSERLTDRFDRKLAEHTVSWEQVDEKLTAERRKSLAFIERAIGEENW